MKLILEVSDASDTSSAVALVYEADAAFVQRLRLLQQLAAAHDLSEVRSYAFPDRVVHRGEDEPGLQAPEVCVSRRDVNFVACDDDALLQARAIDIDSVLAAFESGCETMVVIWSGAGEVDYVLRACGIEALPEDFSKRLLVHTQDGLFRLEDRAEAERP